MRQREWTVIAFGLLGGLALGGPLFRGGATADRAPTVQQPNQPAAPLAAAAAAPAAKTEAVAALERRIAELERQQIAQRVAALEADQDGKPTGEIALEDAPEIHPANADIAGEQRPARTSAAGSTKNTGNAGQRTLDFWNAMNDVIAREAQMRVPPANVTAANAAEFVQARLRAGQFASTAIQALDTTGVDRDAVALAGELIGWYREEVSLNERAGSLLGSSDIAARKGTAGNAWRSGEEQHRRNCDEINRRAADLRERLTRKYGLPFPGLN
jgi:hypothetical protein